MKHQLNLLFSEDEIACTVQRLAQKIDEDYKNSSPILISILKGSFIFLADLVRNMKTPISNIEFIRFSSYRSATVSSGQAELLIRIAVETIRNRDVILVEDIVDTGITTTTALKYLQELHPASLKLCALLDKPSRREQPVCIDYVGLTVPNSFIVGYGIDFAEQYRQLSALYTLK
jgi:hypoxanthine phosphoribosyltransferase